MDAPTITALDCGTLRTREGVLVAGGSTDPLEIPVPAWLIRHHAGTVVFDAGLHPGLAESSESLGRLAAWFEPRLAADGTVGPRLEQHGVDPAGSDLIAIVSHCHFDHVGGLCQLPNARVIVQADEWAAASADDGPYDRRLIELGHDVIAVGGEHDVFGDGTVVCLPTPGHTCGHQSLQVRTAAGPVLLTADACYFRSTLSDGRLPPHGFDLDLQRRTLEWIRRQHAAGTRIVPGHDAASVRQFAR